jgi:hypothetical protein
VHWAKIALGPRARATAGAAAHRCGDGDRRRVTTGVRRRHYRKLRGEREAAVGTTVACTRRRSGRGTRGEAAVGERAGAARLSGAARGVLLASGWARRGCRARREVCCRDARRVAADRWGPLSAISELKITPKEISSN